MKYIDAEKLIAEIERLQKRAKHYEEISLTDGERSYWSGEDGALELLTTFITSLQQEQPDRTGCVWIHKKYNREYRIVSDNARLKNSNGEWIDCVIYAPLYENEFEMFAREKDSFYKEFEKK